MAVLSQELIEYILDFLHTSVPSLTSSSLVSHSWLPTTRYHLFRTPVLYQVSLGRSPKDNTRSFIELLDSPLCTFRHTIQGCVLNIESKGVLGICINALAAHTTLTETLLIAHWRWHDISFTNTLQIPQKFSSIRNFVYSNGSEKWSSDLSQLITSLPNLESLSIFTNVRNDNARGSLPDLPTVRGQQNAFPNLRKLRLRMSNPSGILHWMLNYPGYTPQIDTLDIIVYHNVSTGWGLVGALEPFIVANRDTLKDLSLGLEYTPDLDHGLDNQAVSSLNLGSLPALRSLTLQTHDIDALCQTTTRFLENHPFALEVLSFNLVPYVSPEHVASENDIFSMLGIPRPDDTTPKIPSPYEEDHFRTKLNSFFDGKYTSKFTFLQLNVLRPVKGHVPSDEAYLARAQSLLADLLPSWQSESPAKLKAGILRQYPWQKDSLEKTNITIWGSTNVPSSSVFERIGTL